ncbi:MAG TPA: flagellar biosynthesis regulator FlaF [Hyphomicrobiales bacterium]|nr:flagellar biosynthesis regulator FlaF [Hyphomicrobiales bacterium]
MQEAAQAYARTAQKTAGPRELEAQLLLRAATQLQAVADGTLTDNADVLTAIRYNRKLWTILVSSATAESNPLPAAIKQSVGKLGVFILSHSLRLEMQPARERVHVLVNINREVAAGLRSAAPAA